MVADAARGIISLVSPSGIVKQSAQIPGWPRGLTLKALGGTRVLAWSHSPEEIAVIDARSMRVYPLSISPGTWGQRWVGPAVQMPGDRYAMAPIGDPGAARAEPPAHPAAPLLELRSFGDAQPIAVGRAKENGGRYLTWLGARIALGRVGDTLLAITLSDAKLRRYVVTHVNAEPRQVAEIQLPVYFQLRLAREEIRALPWARFGADMMKLLDTPQLGAATFAPGGRLYVVRNYAFEWRPARDLLFSTQGSWQPTGRGLEIYASGGRFIGAFALPPGGAQWLEPDGNGRILGRPIQRDPIGSGSGFAANTLRERSRPQTRLFRALCSPIKLGKGGVQAHVERTRLLSRRLCIVAVR